MIRFQQWAEEEEERINSRAIGKDPTRSMVPVFPRPNSPSVQQSISMYPFKVRMQFVIPHFKAILAMSSICGNLNP
jgi:hypothetical protein